MDRLTAYDADDYAYVKGGKVTNKKVAEAILRLAAYEDTGLEPDEIPHWIPELDGNSILVPLTKGKFALIDKQDYPLVSRFSWQAQLRSNGKGWYAVSRAGRMHRIILGVKSDVIVDHINSNGLDNRRKNLRIGNQSLNSVNRITTPGRFLRGVRKKGNKWQAYIKIKGKQQSLGYYGTQEEAHTVYLNAAAKQYGDWMPLPQPPKEEK